MRYPLISQDDIENWFTYHPPTAAQAAQYEAIRSAGRQLANLINHLTPDSEEKAQSMYALRSAIMWANAALACNQYSITPGVPL